MTKSIKIMEQKIIEWAEQMVKSFSWLTIKVERRKEFGTCLVDLVYSVEHGDDEEFNREALAFEETMTRLYGDNVPLFTDNGALFTVSDAAMVIANDDTTFTEVEIETAFSMMSIIPSNWLGSSSYNQDVFFETETTAHNDQNAGIMNAA